MIFKDQPDPTLTPAERAAYRRALKEHSPRTAQQRVYDATAGGLAGHIARMAADPAQRTPEKYVTPLEREWRAYLDTLPTVED